MQSLKRALAQEERTSKDKIAILGELGPEGPVKEHLHEAASITRSFASSRKR